jgi:hypothetical protein
MALSFHKVVTLPGTLVANAFYFVENGSYSESYLTDDTAVAKSIGNSAMINSLADARIVTALADFNLVEIVADIAARNALPTAKNQMALVLNATGDATVASGSALYAYRESNSTWYKLSEYESMDVALTWANISGKPASSPATIDDAVSKRHTHTNQATLSEASGSLRYNGQPVGGTDWTTNNW